MITFIELELDFNSKEEVLWKMMTEERAASASHYSISCAERNVISGIVSAFAGMMPGVAYAAGPMYCQHIGNVCSVLRYVLCPSGAIKACIVPHGRCTIISHSRRASRRGGRVTMIGVPTRIM